MDTDVATIIFVWILLSWGTASAARERGRSFIGYLILSQIITPVLSFLLVLLLGESAAHAVRQSADQKEIVKIRCSNCGGNADESASYCPNCGAEL
jgi:hypothetical protein